MKKLFFTILTSVFTCFILAAQPLVKSWDKVIGSLANDQLQCVKPTNDGGFIMSGLSETKGGGDKTSKGFGGTDIWVIKLKADKKTIEWQAIYGGNRDEGRNAFPGSYIEQTADGGYILGTTSESGISGNKTIDNKGKSDYWIIKLSSKGSIVWQKDLGGNDNDFFSTIHELSDGSFIVGGSSGTGINGDKTVSCFGDKDYWVLRLDKQGNKLWDYTYGGNADEILNSILVLKDGQILLGGGSQSTSGGNKVAINKGKYDYWLVSITDNAAVNWDSSFGGDDDDVLYCVDVDYKSITNDNNLGALALAGTSRSDISGDKTENNRDQNNHTPDIWVIKTDLFGALDWDKTLGVSFFEEVAEVKFTPEHNIIVGGRISGDLVWGGLEFGPGTDVTEPSIGGNGISDIWIIKLGGQKGKKLWDKRIGTTGFDVCSAIYLTPEGNLWIGGYTSDENPNPNHDRSQPLVGGTDFWISLWKPTAIDILSKTNNENVTSLFGFNKKVLGINTYPNPTSNTLCIQTFLAEKTSFEIQIRNTTGVLVYTKKEEPLSGNYQQKLNIKDWTSGVYYLQFVTLNGKKQEVKFIKE
jgi:hypothetical protein